MDQSPIALVCESFRKVRVGIGTAADAVTLTAQVDMFRFKREGSTSNGSGVIRLWPPKV